MKLRKITPSIVAFLLLFPFRLPISVGLILLFNWIAGLAGSIPSTDILCGNVVVTKLVYNLVLGAWFIFSIEKASINLLGRGPQVLDYYRDKTDPAPFFWWTLLIGVLTLAYVIYDSIASYILFYSVINQPLP